MSGEKAKYRVLRLSHIHNQLWPEGSEVEYDGEPGTALEPLNDAAKAAKAKAKHKGDVVVEVPAKEPLNDGGEDLVKLKEEYELLFNEKPHHNAKPETLREKIAEKRKELGV
ncbi:hypothetical protein E0D81_12665 [Lelliottia amnigena]|uniref:hypothetical protein n=1 Tax=Lelliottia amnigena TaxID=61646 RepID=UPI00103A1905|nr:hypothetical protein [Lelliottia amnigena]TCD18168.1 hypothetical protein E0D81_12665 [Lelliottia amnigena]